MPVGELYRKQLGHRNSFIRKEHRELSMSFITRKPDTSEYQHEVHRNAVPSPLCWRIIIVGKENHIEIKQGCEKLTDIKELIAEFTSTAEGKQLWEEADKEFQEKLWQQVIDGAMSKIRYHRIIRNIDQKTLAKLTGLHQSNLSRTEKVGQDVTISTCKKIAKALNMDYKELLP